MLPAFPADEPSRRFRFTTTPLDRHAEWREDAGVLTAAHGAPDARFLVFHGDRPLITRRTGHPVTALFTAEDARALAPRSDAAVFLGTSEGAPWFALPSGLDDEALAACPEIEAVNLRALAVSGDLASAEYAGMAEARAMLLWHAGHPFCARCGTRTVIASAGWKRTCPACSAEHFPRTDPAVIMLVVRGDRCLLGRSPSFAEGMVSCLAGFMEPGETIEAAVRRETFEEAGITVGRIAYFASEPWPFPMSLMIGVHAEALDETIRCDEVELEMCRWFDRAEVVRLLDGTHPEGLSAPPPIAIAHHLLRAFCNASEA